jgi:hypothetical protein
LDSYTRNTLFEPAVEGNSVFKRPGTSAREVPGAVVAYKSQGLFEYAVGAALGGIFAVASNYVSVVPSTSVRCYLTGATAGSDLPISSLTDVTQGSSLYTLIQNGEGMWYFDGYTATRVTDPDFPTAMVPGVVLLDGTYYVMDPDGVIYGSDIQDFTSWNPLNFLQVDRGLGQGVQLVRHLNYVMAVMEFGIQLFFDAANATGSPLSPVANASFKIGAPNYGTWLPAATVGDDTFLMIRTRRSSDVGGLQIWQMSGLQFSIISNPHVDRYLGKADYNPSLNYARVALGGLQIEGHSLLFVTKIMTDGSAGSYSLVFDINMKVWTLWSTSNTDGSQKGYFNGLFFYRQYFQPVSNTHIGVFDQASSFTDWDGNYAVTVPVAAELLIPPVDFKTLQRKFLPALYLIADTVNSTVAVSWSDDDGATYSTPRTVDLSTVKKMLQRCGSSRRRSWKITHSAATSMRLYSMEVEVEGGAG